MTKGLLVTCQNCGTTNRLAHERLAATVRCGQCKQALSLPPAPLEAANSADFQLLISKASIPIVVDFWAPWCGPCRMVAPELAKVAARANGRFLIVKVNTDALRDLGERYAIRSIPTLAVFVLGREVAPDRRRASGGRHRGVRHAGHRERFRVEGRSLSGLPDGAPDEERSEPFQIQRRLLRLAHRLHDGGQRVELLADQPDDEVVVVASSPWQASRMSCA